MCVVLRCVASVYHNALNNMHTIWLRHVYTCQFTNTSHTPLHPPNIAHHTDAAAADMLPCNSIRATPANGAEGPPINSAPPRMSTWRALRMVGAPPLDG